jgi:hypothetical protein
VGPTAVTPLPGGDGGDLFSSSGRKGKETVCHKGKEISVASSAVAAHLAHGDTKGACGDPCPCFTAGQVASLAACPGNYTQCILDGGGYMCRIWCPDADMSYDLTEFVLGAETCQGPGTSSSVDSAQHAACFNILLTECPSFDL